MIVKIISQSNNIVIGVVFNVLNKKNIYKNQIGNYVHFCYTNKNESEIGNLDIDLIISNSDVFFQKKANIVIINSSIFLINFLLIENNNLNTIYKIFFNLIFSIKNNNINHTIFCYFDFIIYLLNHLGINFNPYVCIITGQKNTHYISPKTGNAVIQNVGEKYKNKLFTIPRSLKEFYCEKSDIVNAIKIFYYFLEKFIIVNNLFYLKKDFNFLKENLIFCFNKIN